MLKTEPIKPIRIVILLGAPFTAQNFERVGIPYLSKYFEMIVFDCTEWLCRNTENIKCQKVYWQNFLAIKSEMDLALQIERYRPHYAIDYIGFGNFTLDICKILAKYNVKFVVQKTGSLPTVEISVRIKNIVIKFFRRNTIGSSIDLENINAKVGGLISINRIDKLFDKIKLKLQQILTLKKLKSLPNYIGLIAGDKSLDTFTGRSNPIIWIGSNDYHTFNKVKRESALYRCSQIIEPFILFIDDNLARASDWILLGIPPPVTESIYYSDLNVFFEKIESIYDMPVRIAGHPNSISDKNYQSNMRGRPLIFGSTAEQALQSSLVLAHGSTAVSFAVMARKPIIFLTSQELDQSPYGLHVITMSESLGSPLVFIDRDSQQINDCKTLEVDALKYSLYEANYLRNERSNENEPWGAFVEFINSSSQMAENV